MHPEIGDAWKQGYQGAGVTISVIDDFRSGTRFLGDLGLGTQHQRHGGNRPLSTRGSGGLWRRLAVRFPCPGEQLVEAPGVVSAYAAEDVGKIGLRVQA